MVYSLKDCRDVTACRRHWASTGRTGGRFSETEVANALETAWADFEAALALTNQAESSAHGTLATWCFDRAWNLLNHRRKHTSIIPVDKLARWRDKIIRPPTAND